MATAVKKRPSKSKRDATSMEMRGFLKTFIHGQYSFGAKLVHKSESGMSRVYQTWVKYSDNDKLLGNFSFNVAKATGLPYSEKYDGVIVRGTGFSGYQHIEEYLEMASGQHIRVEKL
jgi:hypothetical protein